MTSPEFTELPTEILETIFIHLDPRSLVQVSQTNKLIKQLTTDAPLVWRSFCETHFPIWDSRHDLDNKLDGPLSATNWRELFILRVKLNRRTRELLDQILSTQQGRIRAITEIAEYGYDVETTLLEEMQCPDDAEDVLARRYYANAILERIHRNSAIEVWKNVRNGKEVPMEIALGAYDVFARMGVDATLDVVSDGLDRLAELVLRKHPEFNDLSPRAKASTLATFLRDQGFRGVSDTSYLAVRNSFIGLALTSTPHESLPLISVVIYCALARRVGVHARPCGFLFHVYALVYAPPNHDLDGNYKPTNSAALEFMYLDPFRSSEEVKQSDLIRTLRDRGVPGSEQGAFLGETSTRELVLRAARNIMNSVQTIRQTEAGRRNAQPLWVSVYPDMDNAFYATIWAMLILGPEDAQSASAGIARRRQYLPYLLELFQTHYPWDVGMLTEHVIPLFASSPEGESLMEVVEGMQRSDDIPKEPVRRDENVENVTFKIGQLFTHRRYSYQGVIIGWDPICDAGETWIHHMGVDTLPNGRDQAFYHVLAYDKSIRYVAEENIEPVPPETKPVPAIIHLAGRYFKRWDDEQGIFVGLIYEPDYVMRF